MTRRQVASVRADAWADIGIVSVLAVAAVLFTDSGEIPFALRLRIGECLESPARHPELQLWRGYLTRMTVAVLALAGLGVVTGAPGVWTLGLVGALGACLLVDHLYMRPRRLRLLAAVSILEEQLAILEPGHESRCAQK